MSFVAAKKSAKVVEAIRLGESLAAEGHLSVLRRGLFVVEASFIMCLCISKRYGMKYCSVAPEPPPNVEEYRWRFFQKYVSWL